MAPRAGAPLPLEKCPKWGSQFRRFNCLTNFKMKWSTSGPREGNVLNVKSVVYFSHWANWLHRTGEEPKFGLWRFDTNRIFRPASIHFQKKCYNALGPSTQSLLSVGLIERTIRPPMNEKLRSGVRAIFCQFRTLTFVSV